MKESVVYEEHLTARWMIGTFGLLALAFLFLTLFQLARGPLGPNPAPTWLFLLMFLLFCGFGFNFRRLVIRITGKGIKVSYGLAKRYLPFNSITDCYSSKAHTIRYGGWGIRLWRGKRGWKLIYSVVGTPLVVLELKSGRIREFLFSTRQKDRVIETVGREIAP
jgi:hypothetical protein